MAHGPKDLKSQGFRRIAGALWIKTEPQGNVELADGLQVLRIQRADALTVLEELGKALGVAAAAAAPAASAPIPCQTCHGTGKELIDCDGSAGY